MLSDHCSRQILYPCSVASLGHPNLFKALDPQAYAREPMATQNLIRAPGKREISSSPQPLIASIQPRCLFTGCTPAIHIPILSLYLHVLYRLLFMGLTQNRPQINPSIITLYKKQSLKPIFLLFTEKYSLIMNS